MTGGAEVPPAAMGADGSDIGTAIGAVFDRSRSILTASRRF